MALCEVSNDEVWETPGLPSPSSEKRRFLCLSVDLTFWLVAICSGSAELVDQIVWLGIIFALSQSSQL
jgi:hypothetical protein